MRTSLQKVQGPRSTNDSPILSGRARVIRCICHYAGVSGPMRSHSQNRINDPSESCMHMAEPNPVPQVRLGPVERLIATGISTLAFAMLSWLVRSEEHTSELQSLMRISYAVFCLKKKIYI